MPRYKAAPKVKPFESGDENLDEVSGSRKHAPKHSKYALR